MLLLAFFLRSEEEVVLGDDLCCSVWLWVLLLRLERWEEEDDLVPMSWMLAAAAVPTSLSTAARAWS